MFTLLIEVLGFTALVFLVWMFVKITFFGKKKEAQKLEVKPVDPIDQALSDAEAKLNEMVGLRRKLLKEVGEVSEALVDLHVNLEKWTRIYDNLEAAGDKESVFKSLEKKRCAERDCVAHKEKYEQLAKQENDLEQKIEEYKRLIDRAKSDKGYLQSSLTINKFNAELGEIFNEDGAAMGALNKLREEVQVTEFEAKLARGEEITFNKEKENFS